MIGYGAEAVRPRVALAFPGGDRRVVRRAPAPAVHFSSNPVRANDSNYTRRGARFARANPWTAFGSAA
jgi:hypothetical protein